MSVQVIYEDNHLIVVNKRAGEITQGDKTGDPSLPDLLKDELKDKYQKPGNVFLGVIHRLDRPTSGIVVFAKTSKSLSRMNKLFQQHKVEKIYWAIVERKPQKTKDTLIHHLKKNENQNKSYVVSADEKYAKEAILDYELVAESDRYFLLEVRLKTGRHHQIRTQLSTIGCVIKGDLKYGAKNSNLDGSIALHSREVSFVHPVRNEKVKIIAKVPDDNLWQWFEEKMEKNERIR